MKRIIFFLIIPAYMLIMSCRDNTGKNDSHADGNSHTHHTQEEKQHDHEHESDQSHNHDHDDQNEIKSHDHHHEYETGKIEPQVFNQIIKTSGIIQPSISSERMLVAQAAGVIRYANNNIAMGMQVKEGLPIAYIISSQLADNNIDVRYNQIKVQYENAKNNFERAELLLNNKIISEKEYDQKKSEYNSLKVEYQNIAKLYQKGSISVLAPFYSNIKDLFVEDGQYVNIGDKIACVVQNDRLRLVAEVSQKYGIDIHNIKTASFVVPGSNHVYDLNALNGKLIAVSKALPQDGFYLPLTFEMDYCEELTPGMFVQIYLKGKPLKDQIVIPSTALIEEQGNYFIFVETAHDTFEKRMVVLGQSDGKSFVVKKGLESGEMIVTEGAYSVKLASMSSELPAHNHAH